MKRSNIRMISASAGSGKTYRLTEELTALLDPEGAYRYHPSQIIATTFTRAAAGELRNRVRGKILERGAFEIASMLDQSLIGTVNSISEQLLGLYAFEITLSPVLKVIEPDEAEVLFQKALSVALNEFVREKLDRLDVHFSQTQETSRRVIHKIADHTCSNGIDRKGLEASMADSIESLKCCLPKPNKKIEELRTALLEELPHIPGWVIREKDDTDKTAKCIETCNQFLYKLKNRMVIPWVDWAALAKMEPAQKSNKKKVFDKVMELAAAHMHTQEFHKDLYDYITLCFGAAIESLKIYRQLKSERGLVDFIDQEAFMIEALDNPTVQKRFQQQFRVLMVDEFQDTSPMQLSLFLKMAALVDQVIWVGDPKQAIFGFRGSDAELIGTVTKKLGKLSTADILQNSYRSRPELVEIVNKLFVPAFQRNKDSIPEEQIALQPTRKKEVQLTTPFQLWEFKWEGAWNKKSNEKYNSHVAARVRAFLSEKINVQDPETKTLRPIKAGDIAILCKSNHDCRQVANALRKQGLQAVVSATGLSVTAECRFVRACLQVLVDETDSLSKAEIAFFDNADHDVETLLEERLSFLEETGEDYTKRNGWLADNPVVTWIHSERNALLAEPVSGMLQLLYAGLDVYGKVMHWSNGGQRQANLQQLLFYASEFEDYCSKLGLLPNVHGFLGWFDTLADNEQDERGLVTNELSVNVRTYHAAKGLEWPVVLLYGLDKNHDPDIFSLRVKSKDKIDFDQPLQGRTLRLWPWPYKRTWYYDKMVGHPQYKECCEQSEDYESIEMKQSLEALRLLYVGFTRARDYLVLPYKERSLPWLQMLFQEGVKGFIGDNNTGECDRVIDKNKYFESSLRHWCTNFSNVAEEVVSTGKQVSVYNSGGIKEFAPYILNPSSAESIAEVSFNEGSAIGESLLTNGLVTEEKSAFGTFVHQVMCAYASGMSEQDTRWLVKGLAAQAGINNRSFEKELANRVKGFYEWINKELKPVRIYKELPLMQEKNGQVIVGVADMVVETEEEVVVIDYKTFRGNEKEMKWKASSFSGQLGMYEEILTKEFGGKRVKSGVYFLMEGRVMWMEEGSNKLSSDSKVLIDFYIHLYT